MKEPSNKEVESQEQTDRYPLHGVPVEYEDPTKPVALEDWEVLK